MRLALVIVGILLLAGCGNDSKAQEAQSTATPAAATTEAPSPLKDLCSEWCAPLKAYETKCQFPDADATVCRQDLARGIDAVNAISDELAAADREPMSPVDNVLDAVDRVRESYDTYDDDTNCLSLELASLSSLGLSGVQQAQMMTCQLEANTVAINLSAVGVNLEKAAA